MKSNNGSPNQTAQRSGNSDGPVMGGINLAAYPPGAIPLQNRFYAEELRPVKWVLRERGENSVEMCAEPVQPCSRIPCRISESD